MAHGDVYIALIETAEGLKWNVIKGLPVNVGLASVKELNTLIMQQPVQITMPVPNTDPVETDEEE